jgi:hypothetical protein
MLAIFMHGVRRTPDSPVVKISSLKEETELSLGQDNLILVIGINPGKKAFFKPFGNNHKACSIVKKALAAGSARANEYKEMSGHGVLADHCSGSVEQCIVGRPHVRRLLGHEYFRSSSDGHPATFFRKSINWSTSAKRIT